jgi:hypothetical protein
MNSTIASKYIAFKRSQKVLSQNIVNKPLFCTLSANAFCSKDISKMIYITDYFNTWSDFREVKYKMKNIDFHSVKHKNKEIDTIEFFELFFTKYIKSINIDINSDFIFILKKITNYEYILLNILKKYHNVNIRFIIIESKYNELLLDKNKDDFLCQYLFCFLMKHNDNCILISNDQYRDLPTYVQKYNNINIKILQNNTKSIHNFLDLKSDILNNMNKIQYKRSVIPKHKLHTII